MLVKEPFESFEKMGILNYNPSHFLRFIGH